MNEKSPTCDLLRISLSVAVPLWCYQLAPMGWEHIHQRARACSDVITSKGDLILYRSSKKGESAAAFNALAEGVACLAFAPGGVKTFGLPFEATMEDGGANVRVSVRDVPTGI